MATKLDWDYQDRSGEYHAEYKGIVIRAIYDESPENPFTAWDGHWPMLALPNERHSKTTEYSDVHGLALGSVLGRFNDAALVHDQKAISAALEVSDADFQDVIDDDTPLRKWWTDASTLRECFENVLHQHDDQRARLEILTELYKILGYPVLNTTVSGHSQGDQTDLLLVATPEAQENLRGKDWAPTDAEREQALKDDMESQAKLYAAWAFGDVYGYQLARKVADEDGDETLEDIEGDTSCWGYYGSDFDWSGLEEAAIEAVEYVLTKETSDADA